MHIERLIFKLHGRAIKLLIPISSFGPFLLTTVSNLLVFLLTAISNMDILFDKFRKKLAFTSLDFTRSLMDEMAWDARLLGIRGARGTGKTTMLLQYLKRYPKGDDEALYVSMDDLWFADNRLVDLADGFVKKGGRYLFLDEVHKYTTWAQEVKNIYDDHPELNVVFTGSSLLEILNARADLSRRAVVYTMQGLSFREYLNLMHGTTLPKYPLNDILHNHVQIAEEVLQVTKPLQHFDHYLRKGYYPFVKEIEGLYFARLEEVLNMVIEIELPLLRGVDITYTPKLKQLLMVIAESAPFVPNMTKLSERIGINRNTLISYLHFMQEAGLLNNLYKAAKGIGRMQKPDKIFLENTNLAYAVKPGHPNLGNMRETFFLNQLSYRHQVVFPDKGDFLIDGALLFEIGGKNKSGSQVLHWPQGKWFVAMDGIETGHHNRIPLWLFGFLY